MTSLPIAQLYETVDQCMQIHRQRFRKKLKEIDIAQHQGVSVDSALFTLIEAMERSVTQVVARREGLPEIEFDDNLPISSRREEIAEAIKQNQVVILAGETGSGKTTQIPKICLALGRGVYGQIGHTQPRRIAARTVASRIAEELKVELGETVGFQVRFNDQISEKTQVKLMTDGILLADIQSDSDLHKYDTIIIDEAHERSLNIDFLLGYLKQLLPRRPDLKVIVTSATIDLEKFSAFFNNAPIIEVSGRTFPVSVHYRPWQDDFEDINDAIVDCVQQILALSRGASGDILIFLSGEREIREASHAIKKANIAHVDILPLYARLSLEEQNKIFASGGRRKIVLSTNVAETSLTVPGIRFVIDPGRARISRYSVRTKVQRLPIEAISQASANQRKGRCGRVSEGVCYRLYGEEDFNGRPEFTDPEIQRTNLAAVILQMLNLRIGDVRKFPFVDKPENSLINDGFKLLEEIQAVGKHGKLNTLGRQLHRLPVDPRFARIVLAAAEHECLREILIIISGLSLQDPRERPAEKRQAADEKHRRFWDEDSDFIALINLWSYVEEQRQELSQNQLRKLCKKEFINYLRIREWRDLHHQLRLAIKPLKLKENSQAASYQNVHRALLSGLLSNLGQKSEEDKGKEGDKKERGKSEKGAKFKGGQDYLGSRNRKFQIFPGSSQSKKRPRWLMGAEFIETSQLFAHRVAKIEPEWALDCAQHLLKHHYFQPFYEAYSGQVMAYDRISLLGLVLVEKKRVSYSKIDNADARAIFIREALVEGKYCKHKSTKKIVEREQQAYAAAKKVRNSTAWSELKDTEAGAYYPKHFWVYNTALIDDVHTLEAKARRRDILVDDEVLVEFYDSVVPSDVCNLAGFEHWRKNAEKEKPTVLMLEKDQLMLHGAADITAVQFPNELECDGLSLPIRYHFEPGHIDDGVNVQVPVEYLHMLPAGRLEWLVPGLLRDKCIALVKALPKAIRKKLVPVPQYVDRALARMKVSKRPLTEVLADVLQQQVSDLNIHPNDWPVEGLDTFYCMNIQVMSESGDIIDRDRNLDVLRARYRQQVKQSLSAVHHSIEKTSLSSWSFGDLPAEVRLSRAGIQVKAFPAIVDKQHHVDITVCDNPLEARHDTRRGLVRLAALGLGKNVKYLKKELLKGKDLGLAVLNMGRREQVIDDIVMASVARACFSEHSELIDNQLQFEACLEQGGNKVISIAQEYEAVLVEVLPLLVDVKKQMKANKNALLLAFAFADINHQISELFYSGFMRDTPWQCLQHYPRYVRAIQFRLEKAPQNPQRDKQFIGSLEDHWQRHVDHLARFGAARYSELPDWQEYRWMIEELRVSLYAQTLKTPFPVSDKRLNKQWQLVVDSTG